MSTIPSTLRMTFCASTGGGNTSSSNRVEPRGGLGGGCFLKLSPGGGEGGGGVGEREVEREILSFMS